MKSMKKALPVAAAAGLALVAVGCDFLMKVELKFYSYDGRVVNAQAASDSTEYWKSGSDSLQGAQITLTRTSDEATKTATVDSFGKYRIADIEAGSYRISGTHTGWAFVPRVVDVRGSDMTFPDLIAYPTSGAYSASQILVIAEWENKAVDVDIKVVLDDSNTETYATTFDFATNPNCLYWNRKTFGTPTKAQLDRDVTPALITAGQPPIETFRIISNPFADNIGWIKVYLHAHSNTTTQTGEMTGDSGNDVKEARALVHVMQGTTHYGTFPVASETFESTLMAVKLNAKNATQYDVYSPGGFGHGVYRSIR